MNNFNGYPLFNDVKDPELQAYNRMNMVRNIKEAMGPVVAQRYLGAIPANETMMIGFVAAKIKEIGLPAFMRGLEFEDDE